MSWKFSRPSRSGQSLMEVLVAVGTGAILIVGAVSVIMPALLVSKEATPRVTAAALGAELLNNVRVWSEGDWHNLLNLATGSANTYYLSASSSPFFAVTGASSSFNGYSYMRTMTVNHAYVPGPLSGFPVLVSGTYSWLAATSSGGFAQNAQGYDVIFTSDSGCTSKLNWETDQYASVSGAVNYWVQIPSLASSSDTVFYVCYGNSAITSDQSNGAVTWDANYKGVWHLPDGSTLSGTDSISAGHAMTNNGGVTAAAGQIDGGGAFGAANGYMNTSAFSISGTPNVVSFSAWVKVTSLAVRSTIFGTTPSNTANNWSVEIGNGNGANIISVIVPSIFVFTTPANSYPTDGGWHYVAFTRNGTGNTGKIYVDGVSKTPLSFVSADFVDSGQTKQIGIRSTPANQLFQGSIDEVRVSNSVRSDDWIKTEYNNQSSPGTFYTVGSQAGGSGVVQTMAIGTSTYQRSFYLSDVYRIAGAIVASGGTYDPSTKLVTVSFNAAGGPVSTLSAYLTRHGEMIYDQSDWAGGLGATTSVTAPTNQFVTSSNISYVTTTGSIYIALPGY